MKHKKQARRPTTDVSAIALPLISSLEIVGSKLDRGDPAVDDAFTIVEVFCAIALRVMSKSPPAVLKSEYNTVEIGTLLAEIRPASV